MAKIKHGKQFKCTKKSAKSKCIKNCLANTKKKEKIIPIELNRISKTRPWGNEAEV